MICVSCAVVLGVQLLTSYLLHAPFLKPVDHYAVEVVHERRSRAAQAGIRWESFALAMAFVPSRMLLGGTKSTVTF